MSPSATHALDLEMSIIWGGNLGDAKQLEHKVSVEVHQRPETRVVAFVAGDPVKEPRVLR